MKCLGYAATWQSLPRDYWGSIFGGDRQSALISEGDRAPWWVGIESDQPDREAVRAHSHLRRLGRSCIVAALDGANRRVVLATGLTDCQTRSFSLLHPTPNDLAALDRCAHHDGTLPAQLERLRQALAADDIGDLFFTVFRATLIAMEQSLPTDVPPEARHEIALLQLTRVLFLQFVQARGWLMDEPTYLIDRVDQCLQRKGSVQRDFLHPLFFGTLNLPPSKRRGRARTLGALPFLNGGLFERHTIERQYRVTLPNAMWRSAFDDLFQRFQFTPLRQGSGIDPEMLGRVFEGVMEAEGRRASGTYYTPPALVELILQETLTAWIASRSDQTVGSARHLLEHPDRHTLALLREITILDPAVGSGAFLVVALRFLAGFPRGNLSLAARRRQVLASNLYGVDRHPSAVRLTELRLWLELLTSDSNPHAEGLLPLPNLDGTVRQGDSLVDQIPRIPSTPSVTYRHLAKARHALLTAHGPRKRAAVRSLRRAELAVGATALRTAEAVLQYQINDLRSALQSPDLFGRVRSTTAQRRQLRTIQAEHDRCRTLRRQLAEADVIPWFQYPVQFGDIMIERGGFDLVIGNPPWVRAETLPPETRRYLAGHYRWWQSPSSGTPGYRHQPDVAIAFLERAFHLAAPGGAVGFLLPAKLLTTGYATRCREALAHRATVHLAVDLSLDPRAQFDAATYPLALVLLRREPSDTHRVQADLQGENCVSQVDLRGGGPWILIPDRPRDVIARITAACRTIADDYTCHLGVKTGLNRVFLQPPERLEHSVIRWALRGRDVEPFQVHHRLRMLWPYDRKGHLLTSLPPEAANYCEHQAKALTRRSDYRTGPAWQLFRTSPLQNEACVLWPDIAITLSAAILKHPGAQAVPLNTCYLIPASVATAHLLAAWFNSTWIRTLAWLRADRAASGYRRYSARTVLSLPAPPPSSLTSPLSRTNWRDRPQNDLDECCAALLKLSPRECDALRQVAPPHTSPRR